MAYQITVNTGRGGNVVSTSVSQVATSVVVSNPGFGNVGGGGSGNSGGGGSGPSNPGGGGTPSPTTLGASTDVDISRRHDGSMLVWNAGTLKYEHITKFEVLDQADGTDDDALDYGTY